MKIKTLISVIFLLAVSLGFAAPPFHEAPNNSFEKMELASPEAQSIKKRFRDSKTAGFTEENLRPLTEKDFIQIDAVRAESREQAIRLIRAGKVIAVDSVVGNATRLGNPPGGKGAVVMSDQITFLDAKIFRLAVDSHAIGAAIKQILWTSDENKAAVENLLNTLDARLDTMTSLSPSFKSVVRKYLTGNHITLMAQSTLLPVINQEGELAPERYRNLGAGELIPTIFRSGADRLVQLKPDSIVVFSNIDFDLSYIDVVAASLEAKRPDLMQVHIRTKASGGSAYWVKDQKQWRIVPLEGIEVPASILAQAQTLNSNTVVMQGKALNVKYYESLPLPFEEKNYEGKIYYLPKLSLSDIGKDKNIRTAVALGNVSEYFFTGSKNIEMLQQMGDQEMAGRVSRWNERLTGRLSDLSSGAGARCVGLFHE